MKHVIFAAMLCSGSLFGQAVLAFQGGAARVGTTAVAARFMLMPIDDPPAAIQFTVSWGNGISAVAISAGDSAIAAGLSLSCSPIVSSAETCLLAGTSGLALSAGDLADMQISVNGSPGQFPLSVSNVVAVDLAGSTVAIRTPGSAIISVIRRPAGERLSITVR